MLKEKSALLIMIIIMGTLLYVPFSSVFGQLLRAGVVEFEEKNNIGLENAKVIVPEYLVSSLKDIGRYRLAERIYLKKAFEEQKLQMTGAIDEKTAVEFGKIMELQAVITGATMKVGNEITVSGRVINTQTSEIIAAGTVKFSSLKDLKDNMEKLAYLLSGTSEGEYNRIKAKKLISKTRYGLRLGAGHITSNLNDFYNDGIEPLTMGAFYQSRYVDFDIILSMLCPSQLVQLKLAINPFTHLGFGVGFQMVNDDLGKDLPKNSFYANYYMLLLGANYRTSHKLRAAMYVATPLAGKYWHWPKDTLFLQYSEYHFKVKPFTGITGGTLNMEYNLSESFSVMLNLNLSGGESDLSEKLYPHSPPISGVPETWWTNSWFNNTRVGLMVGYNLPF
ncbi:MAG: hypothetical protein AB1393_03240 [Candidatus Edwardsbacteria bacterium]